MSWFGKCPVRSWPASADGSWLLARLRRRAGGFSTGGSVSAGLAIYDTMQFIRPQVSTMCIGQAASMGALLLAGGHAGKRYCLPHSRVMIHQPLGGFQGQASDIAIHAKEILLVRDKQ